MLSRPVDSTTTPTQTQADVVIQPSRDLVEVLPLYTYLDASAKSSVRPAVRAMMQAEYVAARQLLQEQYKRDITNLQAKYAVDPKADPYTQR